LTEWLRQCVFSFLVVAALEIIAKESVVYVLIKRENIRKSRGAGMFDLPAPREKREE
jgi:hypothetical protein